MSQEVGQKGPKWSQNGPNSIAIVVFFWIGQMGGLKSSENLLGSLLVSWAKIGVQESCKGFPSPAYITQYHFQPFHHSIQSCS